MKKMIVATGSIVMAGVLTLGIYLWLRSPEEDTSSAIESQPLENPNLLTKSASPPAPLESERAAIITPPQDEPATLTPERLEELRVWRQEYSEMQKRYREEQNALREKKREEKSRDRDLPPEERRAMRKNQRDEMKALRQRQREEMLSLKQQFSVTPEEEKAYLAQVLKQQREGISTQSH